MPAVKLSPIFNGWQGFTPGGLPMSGGFIYTYAAGTSTPLASYTTTSGSIANSNPIPLGADGRPPAEIWLAVGSAYKFILTDASLVPIGTYDDIYGVGDVNNLVASGNTVLGTTGNTLNVSNGALVVALGNTSIGADLLVSGNETIAGNLSINGNTTIGNANTDQTTFTSSSITWFNAPTHSNNHTFSGNVTVAGTTALNGGVNLGDAAADAITFVGTPAGLIASGTYTPAISNTVNVAASTIYPLNYLRIGNQAIVSGRIDIDPTASVYTAFELTLPIASNLASFGDLTGSGARSGSVAPLVVAIYGDFALKKAAFEYICDATLTNQSFYFMFMYRII